MVTRTTRRAVAGAVKKGVQEIWKHPAGKIVIIGGGLIATFSFAAGITPENFQDKLAEYSNDPSRAVGDIVQRAQHVGIFLRETASETWAAAKTEGARIIRDHLEAALVQLAATGAVGFGLWRILRSRNYTLSPTQDIPLSGTMFGERGDTHTALTEKQLSDINTGSPYAHLIGDGPKPGTDVTTMTVGDIGTQKINFADIISAGGLNEEDSQYFGKLYERAIKHIFEHKEDYPVADLRRVMFDLMDRDFRRRPERAKTLKMAFLKEYNKVVAPFVAERLAEDGQWPDDVDAIPGVQVVMALETATTDGEPGSASVRFLIIDDQPLPEFADLAIGKRASGQTLLTHGEAADQSRAKIESLEAVLKRKYDSISLPTERELRDLIIDHTGFSADYDAAKIDAILQPLIQYNADRRDGKISAHGFRNIFRRSGAIRLSSDEAIAQAVSPKTIPPAIHYVADRYEQIKYLQDQLFNDDAPNAAMLRDPSKAMRLVAPEDVREARRDSQAAHDIKTLQREIRELRRDSARNPADVKRPVRGAAGQRPGPGGWRPTGARLV